MLLVEEAFLERVLGLCSDDQDLVAVRLLEMVEGGLKDISK